MPGPKPRGDHALTPQGGVPVSARGGPLPSPGRPVEQAQARADAVATLRGMLDGYQD
jgi:hypothetical protein